MMENRCTILFWVLLIYNTFVHIYNQSSKEIEFPQYGILFFECLFISLNARKTDSLPHPSKYRPDAEPSLMCVLLLPLCILNDMIYSTVATEDGELIVGVTAVIIAKYFHLLGIKTLQATFLLIIISVCLFIQLPFNIFILLVVLSVVTWKSLDLIPSFAPKSFSFAEMSICLQWFHLCIGRIYQEFLRAQNFPQDEDCLKWIGCTAIAAIVIATAAAWIVRAFQAVISFLAVYLIFAVLSAMFLSWYLNDNLLVWAWHLFQGDYTVITLLLFWLLCCAITVIWTVIRALQPSNSDGRKRQDVSESFKELPAKFEHSPQSCRSRKEEYSSRGEPDQETSSGTYSNNTNTSSSSVSLNTRKVFHLFILLVYIPGLLMAPPFLFLASCLAFGIFIIIEAVRVFQVPGIGRYLDDILRSFIDDKDQGVLFLTHFYLLVGLSLPLWITYSPLNVPSTIKLYSGVLSLGIGDTIACVFGRAFGRHRWKGTKKTIEGTLSSAVAQMGFIYTLFYLGFLPEYNQLHALIGVVVSSLYEAFTDQIDNLVLPLVLFPFLSLQ